MIFFLSFSFVLLWSSAYISGAVLVDNASTAAALCLRFGIVAVIFWVFNLLCHRARSWGTRQQIVQSTLLGVLFHGVFLGGVFFAQAQGVTVGVVALIVALQPVLTSALSVPLLGESVSLRQWFGIALGLGGAALVLLWQRENHLPPLGALSACVAVLSVTAATLWQKKLSGSLPLGINNMYQALGATLFHLTMLYVLEPPFINWTLPFVYAMAWQILAVSLGAFTIFIYLLSVGSASGTTVLLFLVPPVSAVLAWLVLGESLTGVDIIGLIATSIAVYIINKKPKTTLS